MSDYLEQAKELYKSMVGMESAERRMQGWEKVQELFRGAENVPKGDPLPAVTPPEVRPHPGVPGKIKETEEAWKALAREAPEEATILRRCREVCTGLMNSAREAGNIEAVGNLGKQVQWFDELARQGAPAARTVLRALGGVGGVLGLIANVAAMAGAAEHGYNATQSNTMGDQAAEFAEAVLALGSIPAPTRPLAGFLFVMTQIGKAAIPQAAGQTPAELSAAKGDQQRAEKLAGALSDVFSKSPDQLRSEGKDYKTVCNTALALLKENERDPKVGESWRQIAEAVKARRDGDSSPENKH